MDIKLRWFDKEAHKCGAPAMIYSDKLPSEYMMHWDNKGHPCLEIEGMDCDIRGLQMVQIEGEPMLFTVLEDKNGVEIYEGDVVKVTFEFDGESSTHEVVWGGDSCNYPAFHMKPQLCGDINCFSMALDSGEYTVEIIGNIHINPELLDS